jgi:hypothetical protein
MGLKTRWNYQINGCIRACKNRDIKCEQCWKFDCYEPDTKEGEEK